MAIRSLPRIDLLPVGAWRGTDDHSLHQWRKPGRKRPKSCSQVRRSARTAMCTRAKICGTCAPAVHRSGRFPDRQHLRQISGARHGTPLIRIGFRSSIAIIITAIRCGLSGRHERAGLDSRQNLRRDRPQHQRRGEVRLQLRHHSLTNEIKISGGRPGDLPKSPDISHVVPVDAARPIMRLVGSVA